MPSIGSERATVQNPLVGYAGEIGWAYLTPDQALTLRRGESGALLYQTLRDKLISLNPGVVMVNNVDEVIARIESARNNIEGNAEVLAWLRGERSIYVQSEKRQRNVMLIDFLHPTENIFHVTDEWQFTNGKYTNRADVMFVINGVPVAIVETKSATKKDGIDEGITQIRPLPSRNAGVDDVAPGVRCHAHPRLLLRRHLESGSEGTLQLEGRGER